MSFDLTFHVADIFTMLTIVFVGVRNVELKFVQMRLDIDLLRQRVEWLEDGSPRGRKPSKRKG